MPLDSVSISAEYRKLISTVFDEEGQESASSSSSSYVLFRSPVGLARVAVLSVTLGILFGIHLTLVVVHTELIPIEWCMYALAMCIYHWNEFMWTAIFHPESTSYDSFLVNQSKEYQIAVVMGWVEYVIEMMLFPPQWKTMGRWLGLGLVVMGQTCRSLAMATGGKSFTHLVASEKNTHHVLVTHGIYKYLRHPSYFGWFWWSLGTQILLGNPICFVAYGWVGLKFFRSRVPVEESYLTDFFPQYVEYKKTTWVGIPFL